VKDYSLKSYKGRFTPKNWEKYKGDATNITYRSLLELRFMVYLDKTNEILEWSSEEIVVPYVSPLDRRQHRYFVDFFVRKRMSDGSVQCSLVEIKPKGQTYAPKIPKKKTRKYLTEVMTWGVNSAKWEAAHAYCVYRGWTFQIITDHDLGITYK
jgi:hypothetical protein